MVVAVPEATVEDGGQALVPGIFLLLGQGAVYRALYGLAVTAHHGVDILWATGSALNLEHSHSALHHAVDEAYGLEVLGAHDVLVVYLELVAGLVVGDCIRTAAYLYTLATVGRAVGVVQTHVALAADSHAEGTVAEHLDAYELALGSADVLLLYLAIDGCHLVHIEFAGKHHDIGKLGIEAQRLNVGDIELGGEMHLYADAVAIGHHRHI